MENKGHTHYLECYQQNGRYEKMRYFVKCKILRFSKNNKDVFIEYININNKIKHRYTNKDNLIPIFIKIDTKNKCKVCGDMLDKLAVVESNKCTKCFTSKS